MIPGLAPTRFNGYTHRQQKELGKEYQMSCGFGWTPYKFHKGDRTRGSTDTQGKATGKVSALEDKNEKQNNGDFVVKAVHSPCCISLIFEEGQAVSVYRSVVSCYTEQLTAAKPAAIVPCGPTSLEPM